MKVRALLACTECGQQLAQWAGRCPGCGAWGTIEADSTGTASSSRVVIRNLDVTVEAQERIRTGFSGIDRVLGGGLVPGSVTLLAGEPGIGKSTLLLQLLGNLSAAGLDCLLASGEESREQVGTRARRLGIPGDAVSFTAGRELPAVVEAAHGARPFLLAVDSIQSLRDPESGGIVGGTAQVRSSADALVGLAKQQNIAVLMTGHVTKDGDVAGPRTLEHAVDVVLSFEGDVRTGQRVLAGGKNRFGTEGEVAWFEMAGDGLHEIDPADRLASGEGRPGSAIALPMAGRRALAVEVQSLVVPTDGSARRQVAGLDAKRFQLIAAVVDRLAGFPLTRADLYATASGGVRIDDPGCDLAIAAALASAATGVAPPAGTAFVGEVGLTGEVRPVASMGQRVGVARTQGLSSVYGPASETAGVRYVRTVSQALGWAAMAGTARGGVRYSDETPE
ncbi:MAG: ATPase domain-containing protein [Actinomycetota bacterium]